LAWGTYELGRRETGGELGGGGGGEVKLVRRDSRFGRSSFLDLRGHYTQTIRLSVSEYFLRQSGIDQAIGDQGKHHLLGVGVVREIHQAGRISFTAILLIGYQVNRSYVDPSTVVPNAAKMKT
jgi:hypothetical protein